MTTYNVGDTGHVNVHNQIALDLPNKINATDVPASVATTLADPTSDASKGLSATFARPAIPANVLALTTDGVHNQNAASVLRSWYLALANRDNQRVNLAAMGDSIVEGYGATALDKRWISRLAAALRKRYPANGRTTGGRGYISAFQTCGSSTPPPFIWPVTLTAGVTLGSDQYGLKKDARAMQGGTATFLLNGTSANIVYPVNAGFGTLTYTLDGGAPVTINQNVTPAKDGATTLVTFGTAGSHTLVISGNSSSYLEGVIEYNGDESNGVMVHDGGHGGYRSDQWIAGDAAPWPEAYANIDAHLLIIALGVNDVAQGRPVADYKAAMTSLFTKLRTVYNGPIVLMPYGAVQNQLAAWPGYVAAMYELAAADGSALVADISLRMPNYNDAFNYGAWFDSNHPTDKGHALIGDLMANFLSPS
ncbi:MAG: hypothetical protein JWM23_536 [Microbacteriaceae bacterium]|nr:hypothetical protein [Microbacteriaceae bacterium]